jgi:O-antigen/teichoic acid export membrane protein
MGLIIRQSFKASISNYLGFALGFLSLFILFPLFFTPVELGAVRLFIELGSVLSAFALMGTNSSINRFFPYFKTADQKHHGFFFWALVIPAIGFLFLTLILFISGDSFFVFLNENALEYKSLFPMLICLIFINVYIMVTEVSCANHGRIALTNFSKEVVMRIFIVLSGCLFYFKIISFDTCIWLIVASYGITLILNFFFLSRLTAINLRPDFNFLKENKKLTKEIALFSLVLIFSALSSFVVPKIDFFLVSKLQKDLSNVAIYSIGFYLATFIEIPKRTILQISLPIISSQLKENKMNDLDNLNKKNGTNQLIISSLLFFLIWLNIDNMYAIMPRGDFFAQGKWVVFIIGLSKVMDSVNSAYSPIVAFSNLYKWVPYTVAANSIVSVIINYFFIGLYGYIGGAISNIILMLLVNVFYVLLIHKKLKINPFEKKQMKIVFVFLIFLSISFGGNWFSNPFIDGFVRTSILGVLFVWSIIQLKISDDFNNLILSKLNYFNKK